MDNVHSDSYIYKLFTCEVEAVRPVSYTVHKEPFVYAFSVFAKSERIVCFWIDKVPLCTVCVCTCVEYVQRSCNVEAMMKIRSYYTMKTSCSCEAVCSAVSGRQNVLDDTMPRGLLKCIQQIFTLSE
jgi:hypothetical protein